MSSEVTEFMKAFQKMDERTLAVRALHRCIVRLWVPLAAIAALTIAHMFLLESWWARAVWSVVGAGSGYATCVTGIRLCDVAMRILKHNLDECAALSKETKDDVA